MIDNTREYNLNASIDHDKRWAKTRNLLNKISSVQRINRIVLAQDMNLDISEVIINIKFKANQIGNEVTLYVSKNLDESIPIASRIRNCICFWIPFCYIFSDKYKKQFSVKFNASDFGNESVLSMDSENDEYLIPDEYAMAEFLNLKKNEFVMTSVEDFSRDWETRKSIIFWRGSTTGVKGDMSSINELINLERVRKCIYFRNYDCTDIKISKIIQTSFDINQAKEVLSELDILSDYVHEDTFRNYKYFPDLPGNSQAWGTLLRHLDGNLVFRAQSRRKLLYYRYMQPWIHYIPIASDFSNLIARYSWAESNKKQAALISWRGYLVAYKYLKSLPSLFMEAVSRHLTVIDET